MNLCRTAAILVSALLVGCTGSIGGLIEEEDISSPDTPNSNGTPGSKATDSTPPAFEPAPPVIARLTQAQYANAIRDLLGVTKTYKLAGDTRPYLYSVIGNTSDAVSELGVMQYGTASYDIGSVFSDANKRRSIAACSATAPLTDACLSSFIRDFGLRAWRRPLDADEQSRYHALGVAIGLKDPGLTLQYVTAALLQSPNFLYRIDLGEPDSAHPGWLRYAGYEMASRLSFLLRNSIPDPELLASAASGELVTLDGALRQTNRLLKDAGATKSAVDLLFSEYLDLPLLFDSSTIQFPADIDPNKTLATSMQSEVFALVNRITIDEGGDLRSMFSTRKTSVDANLARLYGLPAPATTGFQPAELPAGGQRAGLLTTGALLSLNNRPYRTAPTLRGRFVFQRMLCGTIAPPPANIPPLMETAVSQGATVREVLKAHAINPACSGCHSVMDPIGLGMEDFDRYGRYRTIDDHGNPVDATGQLAGKTFHGARGLDELIAADPDLPTCLVKQLYRYASARLETPAEEIALQQIEQSFSSKGYAFSALALAVVSSDGFRYLKPEAP